MSTPNRAATLSNTSRTAWFMVALLLPVALLNYLDRQMLASMKYSVMQEITSIGSEANWGFMLGQFKWVYAFFSPIGGLVADRFSRRWVICGSLFVWSAVTLWTGQTTSYSELLWARTLMGLSEAFYIPAALALITDYHTGRTRSRAVGLHQMAIYWGVIAGGFAGYVADVPQLGWRSAFHACGILGMLYAIPLLYSLRDYRSPSADELLTQPQDTANAVEQPTPNSDNQSGNDEFAPKNPGNGLIELLGNPAFLLLVGYFTLPALAGWVVRDWMPAVLKQQFGIGQGQAGVAATLYWQLAAMLGALVGGWLADRWMRTQPRGRIYVSALGMLLIIPAIFGVGNAGTLWQAIGFLIIFGLGWGFFDCNNMPILAQIVRPQLRATGYGLMNLVSISCGGLADWGFGVLRDRQVPLNVIFGVFAAAAAISVLLVLMIRPNAQLISQERSS